VVGPKPVPDSDRWCWQLLGEEETIVGVGTAVAPTLGNVDCNGNVLALGGDVPQHSESAKKEPNGDGHPRKIGE